MRFLGQFLILFLIADSMNYSIFMTGMRINTKIINFSIIWAFSFFAQAVATLLIKHKDEKDNKLEGNAGIGCRRGTKAGEIEQALCAALARIELPPEAPELIATTTVKKDTEKARRCAAKAGNSLRTFGSDTGS